MNWRRLCCKSFLITILAATSATASDSTLKPQVRTSCPLGIPVMVKKVTPIYPNAASALGIQGKVKINFRINKDGVPENLRVASGPPSLIGASLVAIRQWRYKPFFVNGKALPVDTWATINYEIAPPGQTPKNEAQRCTPKLITHAKIPEEQIHFAKGEEFSGLSPIVACQILGSGEVSNVHLRRSSGNANLDKYAVESVKGTRYNSRPGCAIVDSSVDVTVDLR